MSSAPFVVAGDFIGNSALMAQQADYNAEAQNRAFSQSLEAQSMAPQNYASGLRSAGLPVSLAMHGGFQPATAPSPMPVTSHPVSVSAAVQAVSAAEVGEAQANLLNTQATLVGEEVRNKIDERISFDASLRGVAENEASRDTPYASMWQAILDSNDTFSSGSYQGITKVIDLLGRADDSVTKTLANHLEQNVLRYQNENDFAKIIAQMPKDNRAKLLADLSKVYADIFKVSIDSRVSEETVKKVVAETSKILVDTGADYHKDFVGMMKNKDYFGAFMSLGYSALNTAATGAPYMLMPHRAAGSKLISKLPSVSAAPKGSTSFPHPEGYRRY